MGVMEDNESTLKLLKRIKTDSMMGGDGQEFMQYLDQLARENYEAWKRHPAEMNDIHKGYALCVDFLTETFANCDKEVELTEQDQLAEEAFK